MLDLLRIIVYIVSERKVNRMDTKITLDAARINARYTQIEAAGLLGIATETLRAYETGKRSPNWKTLNKMEELYQWPIDKFKLENK